MGFIANGKKSENLYDIQILANLKKFLKKRIKTAAFAIHLHRGNCL